MNTDELDEEIQNLKYNKHKILFFLGKKKTFEKLMNQRPGCTIESVRQRLIETYKKQNFAKLDAKKIAELAKEIIPKPNQEEAIALIDNELFLKYNIFTTTMKSQTFQNKLYLIHIPTRYRDKIQNEQIIDLEESTNA